MSTDNTIAATRQQNMQSLSHDKTVDIADLDGFQLPPRVTEEFLERAQKEVQLLGMVDTMTLERLQQEVPQFGVPVLSGDTRDEEGSRTSSSTAESGEVKFNATDKQYYILVEPRRDAIKNTHYDEDQFGDYIVDQFVQRWGNDVALIGMRAGASSGALNDYVSADVSHLDSTFTGWIARAEGDTQSVDDSSNSTRLGLEDTADGELATMPELDHTDGNGNAQALDTGVFNEAIQTLDSRYRNTDETVFLMNPDQVQQYAMDLTQREDPLGSAVIFGDSDLTPFDYDIVGVNGWPTEYAMFTDPGNLAYGLFGEMELDQTQDTDKVHEQKLHSRNWMEGQMDFQIKEMQAGVLVTGLADPLA
ncbi:P2 family phage major capsid protein [Halorussus halobius]|uniref:P2 family phage major capsid protein n=1 Tax=Halorussus halobius TaxID=1710537 RepID=UPI00109276D6|nr:P2 family phage major capsid protein [Halorussus halobius]